VVARVIINFSILTLCIAARNDSEGSSSAIFSGRQSTRQNLLGSNRFSNLKTSIERAQRDLSIGASKAENRPLYVLEYFFTRFLRERVSGPLVFTLKG
jgi:hypothetical protein